MSASVSFGLVTFGDLDGEKPQSVECIARSLRNILVEAQLADRLDVDFFGVGEHHRSDFSVSAPEVVLGSIAGTTERVRIGTAATVLSADDPVRLFERFSTLDAISGGRAEVILGRGWFNEAFELFGLDPAQNATLFEHKISTFHRLIARGRFRRSGDQRGPASDMPVHPKMRCDPGRVWVAVGSTPDSALCAARHGFPMMLAVIGGPPERFKPMIDLYRSACEKLSSRPADIGIHSSGYVGASDVQAREEYWTYYQEQRNRIGANRGWPPLTRDVFEAEVARGSLYVGSPTTVTDRIVETVRTTQCQRMNIKYSCGGMPHDRLMRSIELFGSKVFPGVRERLSS